MSKPYNTKTLQRNINGAAPEEGGKGKEGLYRHPEAIDTATGKPAELVALSDPLFGNSTADAAVQIGFEYVGPVPEGYVKKLDLQTAEANSGQADSLKGLTARMNQLEGVAERNKELEAQVLQLQQDAKFGAKTDSPAVAESVHQTKLDAAEQIKGRDQAPDADPTKQVGPAPTPEDLPEPEQVSQAAENVNTPSSLPNPDEDEDDDSDEDEGTDDQAGEEVTQPTSAPKSNNKKGKK